MCTKYLPDGTGEPASFSPFHTISLVPAGEGRSATSRRTVRPLMFRTTTVTFAGAESVYTTVAPRPLPWAWAAVIIGVVVFRGATIILNLRALPIGELRKRYPGVVRM